MNTRFLAMLLLLACTAGCTTVTPTDQTTAPSVLLSETQVRKCYAFVTAKIPAGTYEPGYKTYKGTYYHCPTKIIWGFNPLSGGIFIPAPESSDKRQGVWIADYGAKRIFRFDEPLSFQYVNRERFGHVVGPDVGFSPNLAQNTMKVSSSVRTKRYSPPKDHGKVKIEFALPSAGGNSSAGEKHGHKEKAVRLSWWSATGGFDPLSSSELPEWGLLDVVEACAAIDFFSPADTARLIKALAESIERQTEA